MTSENRGEAEGGVSAMMESSIQKMVVMSFFPPHTEASRKYLTTLQEEFGSIFPPSKDKNIIIARHQHKNSHTRCSASKLLKSAEPLLDRAHPKLQS